MVKDAAALRAQIGLAGQYAAVDENLTGRENLDMVGRLYHLGGKESRTRADELLERFDLTDAGKRLVRTYSGGMRRRLDLAAALVARPPVIFLDEPTTGLDPLSRLGLWETIEDRVAGGTTVLLTTQYLDEADRLADSIAVIDHGLVIAEGTSDQLKDRIGGERLEVTLEDVAQAEAGATALASMSDEPPEAEDGTVRVAFRQRQGAIARLVFRRPWRKSDWVVPAPVLGLRRRRCIGIRALPNDGVRAVNVYAITGGDEPSWSTPAGRSPKVGPRSPTGCESWDSACRMSTGSWSPTSIVTTTPRPSRCAPTTA